MNDDLEVWIAAYRKLEHEFARLDWQWQQKHNALVAEVHRLSAELNDYALAEASVRIGNEEAEGCPF